MQLLILVGFVFYLSASDSNDSPPLHRKIIQFTKKLSNRSLISANPTNDNNNAPTSAIQALDKISSFPFYSMSPCGKFFLQQNVDFLSYTLMDAHGNKIHQVAPDVFADCKFRPFSGDLLCALSTDIIGSVVKYIKQEDGSFKRMLLKETLKTETTWYGETEFVLQHDMEIYDPLIQDQFTLFDVPKEKIADTITMERDMRFIANPLIHKNNFLPLFLGYWAEKPHRVAEPIPWSTDTPRRHHLMLFVKNKCVSYVSFDQAAQSYSYSEDRSLVALLSSNKRLSLIQYTNPDRPLIKKSEDDIGQIINEDDSRVFFIAGRLYILTLSNGEHPKTSLFALTGRKSPYKLTKMVELDGAYQLFRSSLDKTYLVQNPASPYNFSRPRTIYQLDENYLSTFDNPQ
jgi:hypothetical protein